MKTFFRRLFKLILGGVILLTGILLFSNYQVQKSAKDLTYSTTDDTPYNKVGLVFGTSKGTRGGGVNLYFQNRMNAAASLYKNGKIKYLIVSGDNSIREYNETRDMKKHLMELGVPEDKIIEDFAGFRTLDSVIRAKEVFGQDSVTFISQKFQNERALFIAKNNDIYGVGFNAKDVGPGMGKWVLTREYFARVKAVLDIYLLNTMPKFYKDKEVFPNEN